jgi:signal transduction histidine kinase
MIEALAAGGVVVGLAVAVSLRGSVPVVPVTVWASVLSIAVSVSALLGSGRTSGALSACEGLGLLGLVFIVLRRGSSARSTVAAGLAVAATLLIIPAHATTSDSLEANAAGVTVWGLVALVAVAGAQYLNALDRRRARSVAEARREQRLALASDLHDFVAHDVSAMVVQAQAGQVAGAGEPARALDALARIEQEGLHALAAMDRALDALRDVAPVRLAEHAPGLRDLRSLIARFEAAGSVRVQLDLSDAAITGVGSDAGITAYRIVSEALTNVRRHAPGATHVRVSLTSSQLSGARALAVTVANDLGAGDVRGRPLDAPGRNGGFGLRALRERVEALGGTLHAGPDDEHGWQLQALLPAADGVMHR